MPVDILTRKETHFILWRPGDLASDAVIAPSLYIGTQPTANFPDFAGIPLTPVAGFPDLWEVAATDCNLVDGTVFFYWFKVENRDAYSSGHEVLYCTDPMAWTIDRRYPAPTPDESGGIASFDPAGVVLFQQGRLVPCDPAGQVADWSDDAPVNRGANNTQLVIYELPTRWARISSEGNIEVSSGTFRDAKALLVNEEVSPTFPMVRALKNRAHLAELGINALELLPPADSDDNLNWGYGTANYFAADFDLGRPDSQSAPTASTDLVNLIKTCHQNGIRFFADMVMAFSRNNPYHNVDFLSFYIKWTKTRDDPEQDDRDGFGGDLFKYNYWMEGYNPISGEKSWRVASREYMKAYLAHWLNYYRIDGVRLDSVNNIARPDFLEDFKNFGRSLWNERGGANEKFLVVGEELSVPLGLVAQNRLDGLWNEKFKSIVRQVILGRSWGEEPAFEWSVRKLIDCRNLGFSDGAQAVNYLTSHDVGGLGNERFYNWLTNNGVYETEQRIKLAFVCLLTAVGIPMILAGDEFADQQDLGLDGNNDSKQVDPVNFSRMKDDWRQRIFNYVSRLVRFRACSPALAVNDTEFIQVDFGEGKKVLVWKRGSGNQVVVVVANFSDYGTPNAGSPEAEYRVPSWPATPAGMRWREITQDRDVPENWVGREPIFPWEAKVYTLQ